MIYHFPPAPAPPNEPPPKDLPPPDEEPSNPPLTGGTTGPLPEVVPPADTQSYHWAI